MLYYVLFASFLESFQTNEIEFVPCLQRDLHLFSKEYGEQKLKIKSNEQIVKTMKSFNKLSETDMTLTVLSLLPGGDFSQLCF